VASVKDALARSWAHITPGVFAAEVREWVETAKQPKFGISYTKLVYMPMLELFDYTSRPKTSESSCAPAVA
jgi:hypothetical protein